MSEADPNVEDMRKRLLGLVKCVIEQAESDPTFAARLGDILLGGSAQSVPRQKGRDKGVGFIPVSVLKDSGEEGLLAELGRKTDDELRAVLRSEGISRGKALKGLERSSMISKIVEKAGNDLKRGTKVAGIGKAHGGEHDAEQGPHEPGRSETQAASDGGSGTGDGEAVGDDPDSVRQAAE